MKKKYIGIGVIYILIIIGLYIYDANQLIQEWKGPDLPANATVGEIKEDVEISGSIKLEQENISAVGLMFGTYNRNNTGEISVVFKDNKEDEKNIYNEILDISILKDNEFYIFNFNENVEVPDKEIYYEIKANKYVKDNAVTLWYNKPGRNEKEIFLNDIKLEGEIIYNTKNIYKKGYFN